MERVSEVLLRNVGRLNPGAVLLVNPPRDALFSRLQSSGRNISVSSQDFGDYRWLETAGAEVSFDLIPAITAETCTVVLKLPREKDLLEMMLHLIASGMPPQARLWLVGENRAGIKSALPRLKKHFRQVTKLDNARHCGLFEATEPVSTRDFRMQEYEKSWQAEFCGQSITLTSLPGVFAHGRLDKGTAMLLEVLEGLRPKGKILDFACGSGVIGLSLLSSTSAREVTMLDASSLAMESARRSLARNTRKATLLPSDGLSELSTVYDWIISNPPFHSGVESDLNVSADFFRRAGTFLKENGRILVVFNRHLPYSHWIREQYANVEILASSNEFSVLQASRPFEHR